MAVPITCPTSSGNVLSLGNATGTTITLLGWSLRVTDANAASIDLKVGGSSGAVVGSIYLPATSGTDTQWFGENGILVKSSILYATIGGTGTVSGAIYVK